MSARAEDAARALSRKQPTTADAAVPTPANNGSADAEGVETPAPEPSGNKNLLQNLMLAISTDNGPSISIYSQTWQKSESHLVAKAGCSRGGLKHRADKGRMTFESAGERDGPRGIPPLYCKHHSTAA